MLEGTTPSGAPEDLRGLAREAADSGHEGDATRMFCAALMLGGLSWGALILALWGIVRWLR